MPAVATPAFPLPPLTCLRWWSPSRSSLPGPLVRWVLPLLGPVRCGPPAPLSGLGLPCLWSPWAATTIGWSRVFGVLGGGLPVAGYLSQAVAPSLPLPCIPGSLMHVLIPCPSSYVAQRWHLVGVSIPASFQLARPLLICLLHTFPSAPWLLRRKKVVTVTATASRASWLAKLTLPM